MLPSAVLVALGWQVAVSTPAVAPAPAATRVIPFRTEARPRVDPVFGDAAALRASIDRFFALEADMTRARDEFGTAVHETLALLAPATMPARACPVTSAAPYARALDAGTRYLALGQLLQGWYRDIRRADDLGDTVALTPDYRLKAKKTRVVYQQLLGDYREMRVAFYDQLGAEMRHVGCKPGTKLADPPVWTLEEPAVETPVADAPPPAPKPAAAAATAIWIEIDNTLCAQPTRISIDGRPAGEIAPRSKLPLRTLAGPREICALPASDGRACGDTGTVRKAYLHEGFALSVHCEQ